MIIEVPYIYTAEVIPPGKRTPRKMSVSALFPVSIREMGDDVFPLAARFVDNSDDVRYPGTLHDLRFDGRFFYMGYCDPNPPTDNPLVALNVRGLHDNLQGHDGPNPFRSIQKVRFENDYRNPMFEEGLLEGRVELSDKVERTALLGAKASEVVICDGKIWERCGEPCYMVGRDPTAETLLADWKSIKDFAQKIWRGDKLAEAQELHLGGHPFEYIYGKLEVILPEAFRSHIGGQALLNCANSLLDWMGHYLQGYSKERLMRYADLRDALAACEEAVTLEVVEAIQAILSDDEIATYHQHQELKTAHERWRRECLEDVPAVTQIPVHR